MDHSSFSNPYFICLVVATTLFVFGRSGSSRRQGAWTPQGPSRSFDECFPEQPVTVRQGIVAERKEVLLPEYSFSAVKRPHQTLVPHYAFTIICHDVVGEETLRLSVPQDKVNVFADVGRNVEVKSQLSRLDYHHMVHAISAT